MADDDIDIEEHDLLDNPLVQKMFPDLSIFKKETVDFINEEPVGNIFESCNINDQKKIYHQVINEQPNSLAFPKNSTDKVYTRIFADNKTEKELQTAQKSIKKMLCREVTTSHNMKEKTNYLDSIKNKQTTSFNIAELCSLVIEKKLDTPNFCEQNVIEKDVKLRSPMLLEVLKKTSEFPKYKSSQCPREISQKSVVQNENIQSPVGSTCSVSPKSIYVEDHKLDNRKKSEQTIGPMRGSIMTLKSNKIIIRSKPTVMHANEKISYIVSMSKNVKVTLENLNTFLSKSNRYCKICCRLFPSNKTLADHQNLIHTQSDDSQSHDLAKDMPINHNNGYECSICGVVSSSPSDLLSHERSIHSINKISVQKEAGHLKHNVQSQSEDKLNTESENFKCRHCNNGFASQQLLIDHMYNVILTNNKNIQKPRIMANEKRSSTRHFYRCSFCSSYFKQPQLYMKHVKNKHGKNCRFTLEKVAFDPKCRQCSTKYCHVNSFNVHVWKHHLNKRKLRKSMPHISVKEADNHAKKSKLKEQITKLQEKRIHNMDEKDVKSIHSLEENSQKQYLLKSALFKCMKCDICFLSATKAADHVDHMDKLINWKCLKCLKIFKREDKLWHTRQHLFTDAFEVYEIRGIAHLSALYKCPNCATYFLEKDVFSHYSTCDTQSPLSVYCKTCHNLIDNKIKDLHDAHHKQLPETTEQNILFVESDIISFIEENYKTESFEKNTRLQKKIDFEKKNLVKETLVTIPDLPKLDEKSKGVPKIPSFTYCITCRCFVRRTPNLYYHTKGRCSHVIKYVCRFCGLMLSNKSINFHRKLHKDIPGLTLHDFKFYDLNSGKIICPPVPKYPNCNKCGKHFITKTAIIGHQCSENYLTCPVCKIKLSHTAFPLHASFHNYFPKTEMFDISNNPTIFKSKVHPSEVVTDSISLVDSNKTEKNNQLLVYVCKSCRTALNDYDIVIEHCQNHISGQETEINTKPCDKCNLLFDVTCFDNHSMLHVGNRDKEFIVLSFDVCYATAEHNVWLNHLFGSLSEEFVNNILEKSIYKFERKVKLKIVQDGLKSLTLYKCAKCKKYIDPTTLYQHCQIDILCFKSKTLRCRFCGIQLVSEEYLKEHEKIHKQQNARITYRIVLFNCDEDKSINHALSLPHQYVLYECRNCNRIVNKVDFINHKCDYDDLAKCSHCGLLISTSDYMTHVLKHKEYSSFNESNMKIILIGQVKNDSKFKKYLVPSFTGIRLDYLMYQCNKCLICVKDKESSIKHDCINDNDKTKCVLCELYIEDSQFKNHRKFHECNLHFVKENITVVKFGLTNHHHTPPGEDVIVIEDDDDLENIPNKILELKNNKTSDTYERRFPILEKSDDIFKCKCGLHFLNKQMTLVHSKMCNNSSSNKQTCSKCGLDFTPSGLYSHIFAHHGTKNICYKFNIIEIP